MVTEVGLIVGINTKRPVTLIEVVTKAGLIVHINTIRIVTLFLSLRTYCFPLPRLNYSSLDVQSINYLRVVN